MFLIAFTITIICSYSTFSYIGGIIGIGCYRIISQFIFGYHKKSIILGIIGYIVAFGACFIQQQGKKCEPISDNHLYQVIDILSFDRAVISQNNCNYITYIDAKRGDIINLNGGYLPYPQRILNRQTPKLNQILDRLIGYRSTNFYWGLKGISGQLTSKNTKIMDTKESFIDQIRNYLSENIQSSSSDARTKALAGGILRGDRSGFESDLYQIMIQSGLIHLIAISGSNISFILLIILRLCKPLPVYLRYVVAGGAMVGYSIICGGDSSVVRATIMGGYGLLALITGNKKDAYYTLAITRIGMGIYNPLWIVDDRGMRLSFGGAIGITIASDYCGKFTKNKFILWFLSTSGVTIWMRGIIAWLTGYINLTTRVTGLVTSPIGGILMTGSIVYTRGNQYRIVQYCREKVAHILLQIGQITTQYGLVIDINQSIRGCVIIILFHILAYHYLTTRGGNLIDNSI